MPGPESLVQEEAGVGSPSRATPSALNRPTNQKGANFPVGTRGCWWYKRDYAQRQGNLA